MSGLAWTPWMQRSRNCPQLQTLAMPTPSRSRELQTGGLAPGRQLNLASLPPWRESDRGEEGKATVSIQKADVNITAYTVATFAFSNMYVCSVASTDSIPTLDPFRSQTVLAVTVEGFLFMPHLGRGRYPSFLALKLHPLLLWCAAALRVQPCAGGRSFSTRDHHRACLCWRTGVLGSRRG